MCFSATVSFTAGGTLLLVGGNSHISNRALNEAFLQD